ncbi:MAG: hypothetical protein U0360_08025 [Dehalococcoidia bacterium]
MERNIGLAYGITGAAIATAVIAITASTTGLFERGGQASSAAAFGGPVAASASEGTQGIVAGSDGGQFIFVDAPASGSRGEHERSEHRGHDDDD